MKGSEEREVVAGAVGGGEGVRTPRIAVVLRPYRGRGGGGHLATKSLHLSFISLNPTSDLDLFLEVTTAGVSRSLPKMRIDREFVELTVNIS